MSLVSMAWSRSLLQSGLAEFTTAEVQAGPYVIYGGKVYDVSYFRHPGGSRRLQRYVGKDATDVLNRKHSSRDRATLEDYLVGVLVD